MNISINIKSIGETLRSFNIDEWLFYAKLSGDHHATAFVLRRIIIWSGTPTVKERGGWFWKSHDEMSQETGLSEYQIRQAQKRLSKLVQVKIRKHNGKSITWYRIKRNSLIRAIMTVISRLTGKKFSSQSENTAPTLRERFKSDTLKNLSRHTLTSYSNSSDSDNQTHTSVTQNSNVSNADVTPTTLSDDDDLKNDLPSELKNYSFTGDLDAQAFTKQIKRVGQNRAIDCIERCVEKGGKSWQYMLTALNNLPDYEQSEPLVVGIGMQPAYKEAGQWTPTGNNKYSDIIKR